MKMGAGARAFFRGNTVRWNGKKYVVTNVVTEGSYQELGLVKPHEYPDKPETQRMWVLSWDVDLIE